MSNNTQLPAEVWDKIQTKALVLYPVALHYVQGEIHCDTNEYARNIWLSGATEYANKLHELQQSNHALAGRYLKLDEKYIAAMNLLSKVKSRHEGGLLPDRFIYNEIKSFLDGK